MALPNSGLFLLDVLPNMLSLSLTSTLLLYRVTWAPDDTLSFTIINMINGTTSDDPGSSQVRLNLTQFYPGGAARSFEHAMYIFERYVLGWDPKKKRPLRSDLCTSHMFVPIWVEHLLWFHCALCTHAYVGIFASVCLIFVYCGL